MNSHPQTMSEKVRAHLAFRPFRWLGTSVLGIVPYETAAAHPEIRNAIHETAFNLYQHAGNVAMSTTAGVLAGLAFGGVRSLDQKPEAPGVAKRQLRQSVIAAGAVTGMVLNTLSETRWGMRIIHIPNTPDPWDAIYGTVAATIGAAAGVAIEETQD